jgi:hypothetical protein
VGAAAVALVGLVAVGGVLLARNSPSSDRAASREATPATLPARTTFRLAGMEVPATGAATLPDPVLTGVLATLNRYLDGAVLAPMRSGKATSDLSALFTGTAAQRLTGPDRATLVEEGTSGGGSDVGVDDAWTSLTGLLDAGGSISVVAAKIDVVLRSKAAGEASSVARSGELVLVPEGGGWRIDGYDLRVTREPAGETSSAAAARP